MIVMINHISCGHACQDRQISSTLLFDDILLRCAGSRSKRTSSTAPLATSMFATGQRTCTSRSSSASWVSVASLSTIAVPVTSCRRDGTGMSLPSGRLSAPRWSLVASSLKRMSPSEIFIL